MRQPQGLFLHDRGEQGIWDYLGLDAPDDIFDFEDPLGLGEFQGAPPNDNSQSGSESDDDNLIGQWHCTKGGILPW